MLQRYNNSSICQIFKNFKAKANLPQENLVYLKDQMKKKFMKLNRALIRKKLLELTKTPKETNNSLSTIVQ